MKRLSILLLVLGSLSMTAPSEGSDDDTSGLGQRIKQTRVERGLTLSQAARELNVARSAYRLWELGVASPQPKNWQAIAEWLGVPLPTILREQGLLTRKEERAALAAGDGSAVSRRSTTAGRRSTGKRPRRA